MLDITMINRPRCTGKTSQLKLMLHEHANTDCLISLLSYDLRSTEELRYYARQFNYRNARYDIYKLRGIKDKDILILIDEPFIIPKATQAEILNFLNHLAERNNVTVFGIGTLADSTLLSFEQYIQK